MPKPPGAPKQRKAQVTLKIGTAKFKAESSTQYGHAEMAALRKFIVATEKAGKDPAKVLAEATTRKVKCPNQDVCNSCRMIVKALGFVPDGATVFSKEPSGGVSWGANLKVKGFLESMGLGAKYTKAIAAGKK